MTSISFDRLRHLITEPFPTGVAVYFEMPCRPEMKLGVWRWPLETVEIIRKPFDHPLSWPDWLATGYAALRVSRLRSLVMTKTTTDCRGDLNSKVRCTIRLAKSAQSFD